MTEATKQALAAGQAHAMAMAVGQAQVELRDEIAGSVIGLVRSLALVHGNSPLELIPGVHVQAALMALSRTVALAAQELEVLAGLCTQEGAAEHLAGVPSRAKRVFADAVSALSRGAPPPGEDAADG